MGDEIVCSPGLTSLSAHGWPWTSSPYSSHLQSPGMTVVDHHAQLLWGWSSNPQLSGMLGKNSTDHCILSPWRITSGKHGSWYLESLCASIYRAILAPEGRTTLMPIVRLGEGPVSNSPFLGADPEPFIYNLSVVPQLLRLQGAISSSLAHGADWVHRN